MRACSLLFIFFFCVFLFAEDLPIYINERAGAARSSDPVTFGIPFPIEARILTTDYFAVLNGSGTRIPAQFRITGRWGGAPDDSAKPARWVLVDFQ
jgi:hypothetical protein